MIKQAEVSVGRTKGCSYTSFKSFSIVIYCKYNLQVRLSPRVFAPPPKEGNPMGVFTNLCTQLKFVLMSGMKATLEKVMKLQKQDCQSKIKERF